MNRNRQGQAPYGFRWQSGALVVVPEEARVRRLAAELLIRLKSCSAVARELNGRNEKTRREGKWSDVQVARLLNCPSAIGRYDTGRSESAEGGRRKKTESHDRVVVDCEPIIPRETWDRVQQLLRKAGSRAGEQKAEPAPLAGLVWCRCGQRMRQPADSTRFKCPSCELQIGAADLESVFAEDFIHLIANHPALASALGEPSPTRALRAELAGCEHELSAAERERAAAERMFAEGVIQQRRFEELHGPLESRVRAMEDQITGLRAKLPAEHGSATAADADAWVAMWSRWPNARRRQIIHTFVERFVVGGGEIEVRYLVPEPSGSEETTEPRQITPPTNQTHSGGPTYVRLPKPGTQCPYSGLSRAKLNELILPNERNGFDPPVASKSIRQKGAQRGIRLVLLESLMAYLSGKS